ncbi:MAG: type II secretion system F family protein [Desulfobacterales bacterium]|nr:type II secretion system F family protein [Desulfobacterales bacterium]
MPVYSYKASDRYGKITKGIIESSDEASIIAKLHDMSYIPMKISILGDKGGKYSFSNISVTSLKNNFFFFKRISSKDIMLFTQDLSNLLHAGIPLDRSLNILVDITENERFKDIINNVLNSVKAGAYLSDALSKYQDIFSDFYVNMLRAGEEGGILDIVLARLSVFLESSEEFRDYVKSALVYPIFLMFAGGISIIVLLIFVIPKFAIIFSDMGNNIPMTTLFLLALSDFIRFYWWGIIFIFLGLYLSFIKYKRTSFGRLKIDSIKIKLPFVGGLVRKNELARFARTLGTLSKSGVPILKAIKLVRDIITNKIISNSMENIHKMVKEGERLSKALDHTGIFPSLAVQMITVGEETGKLDEMLLRVAENYEKDVKNMVKKLISFIEPAMILGMGLVVGFIVISMLMAVFSINDMPF